MIQSERAVQLIVNNEWGVRGNMPITPKVDEKGRMLIGIGHVFLPEDIPPLTREKAFSLLHRDLQSIAVRLNRYNLTQRQFDAMSVWAYYASQGRCESILGETYEKCRIWEALGDGKPVIAGSYITDWTYLEGRQSKPLINRRKAEVHMFHYGEVLR